MQTCNVIYRVSFEPRPSEEITWYRGIFFNHPLFTSVSLLHFDLLRNLIPPRTGRRCALTRWKRGIRITAVDPLVGKARIFRAFVAGATARNRETFKPFIQPFRSNVCFRLTAQPVPEFRTLGGKNSKFVRLGWLKGCSRPSLYSRDIGF